MHNYHLIMIIKYMFYFISSLNCSNFELICVNTLMYIYVYIN